MLLRTAEEWFRWISDLDFGYIEKVAYAASFEKEEIKETDLPHIGHNRLKACKVKDIHHRNVIIVKACGSNSQFSGRIVPPFIGKNTPNLVQNTERDMDNFIREWEVYKKKMNLTTKEEIESNLVNCCAREVREILKEALKDKNKVGGEGAMLAIIKHICVPRTSCIPHLKKFRGAYQMPCESVKEFHFKLHQLAKECRFKNPEERIREQFMFKLADRAIRNALEVMDAKNPDLPLHVLYRAALDLEIQVRQNPHEFKMLRCDIPYSDEDDKVFEEYEKKPAVRINKCEGRYARMPAVEN